MSKVHLIAMIAVSCIGIASPCLAQEATPKQKEAKRLLAEERGKAKKAGLPLTPQDLPKENVPASRNLATYVAEFSKRANKEVTGDDNMLIHDRLQSWELPTPQDTQRATALFQRTKDLWSLIEKGLTCTSFSTSPEHTLISGMNTFPRYATLRSQARWIVARTTLLLTQHQYKAAIKNQTKGLLLAHIMEQKYPSLINLLVSHAVYHIALKGMQKILHIGRTQPGIAEAVAKAIEDAPLLMPMSSTIPIETLSGISIIQTFRKALHESKNPAEALQPWDEKRIDWEKYDYNFTDKREIDRVCDNNEIHLLQAMQIAYRSFRQPYYQRTQSDIQALAEMKKQSATPDYCIAVLNTTTDELTAKNYARLLANRVVTITFARVLAWREKHGQFPNALKEVLPEEPSDPFDGKPLRYRKEGKGFVVYSVGESLKYDGTGAKMKNDSVLSYSP